MQQSSCLCKKQLFATTCLPQTSLYNDKKIFLEILSVKRLTGLTVPKLCNGYSVIKKFNRRLRNIFLTGFLITLPIALTIFILNFLFKSLDSLSPVFTHWLILLGAPIPEGYRIPFLGVVMTFVIVFLVGAITTNIFGKRMLNLWEGIVEKIPFVRRIYKGTKQVVSSFATMDTKAFTKVVLIEFPRKGAYAIAFITGNTSGELQRLTSSNHLKIFIPTTPNPTSGFIIFTDPTEVIELNMTIEQGIKYVVSGGIVSPEHFENFITDSKV